MSMANVKLNLVEMFQFSMKLLRNCKCYTLSKLLALKIKKDRQTDVQSDRWNKHVTVCMLCFWESNLNEILSDWKIISLSQVVLVTKLLKSMQVHNKYKATNITYTKACLILSLNDKWPVGKSNRLTLSTSAETIWSLGHLKMSTATI